MDVISLLKEFETLVQMRQRKLGNFGANPNRFNLFKVVSDKYRKENLHSDILAYLLDNEPSFLNLFLEQADKLGCMDKSGGVLLKETFDTHANVFVRREKGRIDILIHNDKQQAIIIENKLNGFTDMDTQLCRYYQYAVEHNWKVLAILYLPREKGKVPNIGKYSCEICKDRKQCAGYKKFSFETQLPKLTKVIEIEPLIEMLNRWVAKSGQDEVMSPDMQMFVRHYADLLSEIGVNCMTYNENIDILKKIFEDKTLLNTANVLAFIWQNKQELLKPLVGKRIVEKLQAKGYKQKDKDDIWNGKDGFLYKELSGNPYFEYIIYKPEWLTFALKPKDGQVEKANYLLANEAFEKCDYLSEVRGSTANFKHRNFDFKKLPQPLETLHEIVAKCVACYDKLEELVTQEK